MSPRPAPEGIWTAPCSGGLTFYGRAPRHCSMQAHMCPSACLLTPEHPASPTLCWGQGPAETQVYTGPARAETGQPTPREAVGNKSAWLGAREPADSAQDWEDFRGGGASALKFGGTASGQGRTGLNTQGGPDSPP